VKGGIEKKIIFSKKNHAIEMAPVKGVELGCGEREGEKWRDCDRYIREIGFTQLIATKKC